MSDDIDQASPDDPVDKVRMGSLPGPTRVDLETEHKRHMAERAVKNTWPFPSGKDWLLAHLASLANISFEAPVTLTVGGSVISGILISGLTYLSEMNKIMEPAISDDALKKTMRKFFSDFERVYRKPEGEGEDWTLPPPHFIHLRNAQYLIGAGLSPVEGLLWRGRIEAVDGFSWGTLGSDSP